METLAKPMTFILGGDYLALEMARELGESGYQVAVICPKAKDIVGYSSAFRVLKLQNHVEWRQEARTKLAEISAGGSEGKVLLGSTDEYCLWLAENLDFIEGRYLTIGHQPKTYKNLLDKREQLSLASASGIKVPKTVFSQDLGTYGTGSMLFPVIVKPRYSHRTIEFREVFGAKVLVAKDRESLTWICRTMEDAGYDPMIQEIIPGAANGQYLFGAVSDRGRLRAAAVMRKVVTDPKPFGSGVVVETVRHRGVLDHGASLLEKMCFTGICDMEFIQEGNATELSFVEMNPRYGLGQRAAVKAGVSLAGEAVRLAMGGACRSVKLAEPGYTWVYFDEWLKESFLPWRNSASRRTRSSVKTAPPFYPGDPGPEIRHLANLLGRKAMRSFRPRFFGE